MHNISESADHTPPPALGKKTYSSSRSAHNTKRSRAWRNSIAQKHNEGKKVRSRLLEHLPETAQLLWHTLQDREAVEKLLAHFGGTSVRIPQKRLPESDSEIMQLIGAEHMKKLMRVFGGTVLYIPQCKKILSPKQRRQLVATYSRLLAEGESAFTAVQKLARQHQISERWVRHIVNSPLQHLPPPQTHYLQ